MVGLRYGTAFICAAAILVASDARASDAGVPALSATMACERAVEPGRVKCSIEARAPSGKTLAWADVTLVELPELASALKGRIGPADATAREASMQRWAFGLVAKRAGEGEARARVRAVVCEGDAGSRCAPLTVDVRALVKVG